MFCKDDLQSSYTFGRNVHPLINLTLCGVPPPNVTWSYHEEGGNAIRESVNSSTHKYLIRLLQLTQKTCGRDLVLNATGHNSMEKRLPLFLDSCKYWNNPSRPWRFLKFYIGLIYSCRTKQLDRAVFGRFLDFRFFFFFGHFHYDPHKRLIEQSR